MSKPQNGDYLWDGSGTPDAEAQRLEKLLAPLAPPKPRVPRPRRGFLVAGVIAALTFAFVMAALPPRAVPSRIAGLFHDDFPGEIGVRGGTRVEYSVVGDEVDLDLTREVAEDLRERGANVVFVRRGAIIIDLVGVAPRDVNAWTRGIGAYGSLEITSVEHDTELMRRIYAFASEDERARELGISAEVDLWRDDQSGQTHRDYYLAGPDQRRLEAYFAEIAEQEPALAAGPGTRLVFEVVHSHDVAFTVVRSYLVQATAPVTQEDIADAMVIFNPTTNQPEVMVTLTGRGGQAFADLTRENVGRKLAILLDGKVESAPVIISEIPGGRLTITPGASQDPSEVETLVAAFLQGTLAAPVSLTSVSRVEPVLTGLTSVAARGVLAFPLSLLAFALALVIARRAPRIDPDVFSLRSRERTGSGVMARIAVTTGAGLAAALCVFVPLPGIDAEAVREIGAAPAQFSVFALGLGPVISAFLLVELAALIVPRWRRLRISGPTGRAKLGTATALLTVVLAGAQAWFLTTWFAGFDEFPGGGPLFVERAFLPQAAIFLSLVGGTLVLVVLAAIVSRRGVGNGYVVVLFGGMAYEAYQLLDYYVTVGLSATSLAWLVALTAAIVGTTNLVLRLRVRGGESRLRLQLPTCGYVPLAWTTGLFALAGLLATMRLHLPVVEWLLRPDGTMDPWLFMTVAAVLAVVCSLLFSLPVRFEGIARLVHPKPAPRFSSSVFWQATLASAIVLLALAGLYLVGASKLPQGAPDILWLAMVTAALMDLTADIRARHRNGRLVPVWSIHRVQLTDLALDALRNQGIDAHAQSLYFRKLFFFFAPYVPIRIMVPEDKADDAHSALDALLGDPTGQESPRYDHHDGEDATAE